jgi:hypothetical protein
MRKFTSPLEGVRVAAPCPAEWEKMVGDERMRYCGRCSLHVYNLSGMTKRAAETLVANAEGRLCVRYYRRADGSILTRNCPVGLRAVKQRVTRIAGAALSAVLGFFAGLGLDLGVSRPPTTHTMGTIAMPAERNLTPPPVETNRPPTYEVPGDLAVPIHHVMGRMRPPLREENDAAVPVGRRPQRAR